MADVSVVHGGELNVRPEGSLVGTFAPRGPGMRATVAHPDRVESCTCSWAEFAGPSARTGQEHVFRLQGVGTGWPFLALADVVLPARA